MNLFNIGNPKQSITGTAPPSDAKHKRLNHNQIKEKYNSKSIPQIQSEVLEHKTIGFSPEVATKLATAFGECLDAKKPNTEQKAFLKDMDRLLESDYKVEQTQFGSSEGQQTNGARVGGKNKRGIFTQKGYFNKDGNPIHAKGVLKQNPNFKVMGVEIASALDNHLTSSDYVNGTLTQQILYADQEGILAPKDASQQLSERAKTYVNHEFDSKLTQQSIRNFNANWNQLTPEEKKENHADYQSLQEALKEKLTPSLADTRIDYSLLPLMLPGQERKDVIQHIYGNVQGQANININSAIELFQVIKNEQKLPETDEDYTLKEYLSDLIEDSTEDNDRQKAKQDALEPSPPTQTPPLATHQPLTINGKTWYPLAVTRYPSSTTGLPSIELTGYRSSLDSIDNSDTVQSMLLIVSNSTNDDTMNMVRRELFN